MASWLSCAAWLGDRVANKYVTVTTAEGSSAAETFTAQTNSAMASAAYTLHAVLNTVGLAGIWGTGCYPGLAKLGAAG